MMRPDALRCAPQAWRRLSAWLMALLLTLVVAEPFRAHACPIHSLAAAASADAEHDAHDAGHGAGGAGGAAHDAPAPHGAGVGHDAPADGPHAPGDGGHLCDCLGLCGLAALLGLPTPATARVAATVARAAGPPPPAAAVAAGTGEHVLPFANGPPAVA